MVVLPEPMKPARQRICGRGDEVLRGGGVEVISKKAGTAEAMAR